MIAGIALPICGLGAAVPAAGGAAAGVAGAAAPDADAPDAGAADDGGGGGRGAERPAPGGRLCEAAAAVDAGCGAGFGCDEFASAASFEKSGCGVGGAS
ncbi:hypothetical protein [Acidocella sp. C78]|uniref:hypothetical protein n=1 Tax=Acidocella sp. C78 TaxID=1671486 RepID=UPI0020BE90DA|nr:hypothetical protein [Acidocella sp. C78]